MIYVITAPASIVGVYENWPQCKAAVTGVPGARYQKVKSRKDAEALLSGRGIVLEPGLYAFTDGSGNGGVGVVVLRTSEGEPHVIAEISSSVRRVFIDQAIVGLEDDEAITTSLARLRNILAELAGLYAALMRLPRDSEATVVHDYEGVGAWMTNRWETRDPIVTAIISTAKGLANTNRLRLRFVHQSGHMSSWAGRNDLARFNSRADELADEGNLLA